MKATPPRHSAAPRIRVKGETIVFETDNCTFAVTRAEARDVITQVNAALTHAEPADWDIEDHTPEAPGPWTAGRG